MKFNPNQEVMFYFSFINRVLNYCQQEANKHLWLTKIIGRRHAYGVSPRACPLCLVDHTSMYLNGQIATSHRRIHAPAPCGHFLKVKEKGMS